MSSWMPSLRRTGSSAPLEDAPLSSLPASESGPLRALEDALSATLWRAADAHSADDQDAALHERDPWRTLPDAHRRALALRFLRYHALHIGKAAAHVERVAEWRVDERPWTRTEKTMRDVRVGIPLLETRSTGTDSELLLYAPARLYVKAEIDHVRQETAIKTFFERVFYAAQGPRARSVVLVMDFQGFSMRNVDLVATRNGIRILLQYYPEALKKVLVVNYPKLIYGTWKVVVPLLDARTVRKVEFLGAGKEVCAALSKYFDKGQVPRWLGGDGEDGNLELYTGQRIDAEEVSKGFVM